MTFTRRAFIKVGTLSAAAIGTGATRLHALSPHLTAYDVMPDQLTLDDPRLRELAMRALDAAKRAGAEFADVRINIGRRIELQATSGRGANPPEISFGLSIGVRAVVAAAWGFAGNSVVTPDGVERAARLAVERARGGRSRAPRPFEFAANEVVADGFWETPIEKDPFAVPIAEQEAFWLEHLAFMKNAVPKANGWETSFIVGATWLKSERVFASTEGSFIRQRAYTAGVGASAIVSSSTDITKHASGGVDTFPKGAYGYEAVSRVTNLKALWLQAAESAKLKAVNASSGRSVDVGRYDLVLSPKAVAPTLLHTVANALNIERALGDHLTHGTTYAMPPMDVLGKFQLGSRHLTVRADRSRAHSPMTVGWDEEGVKPDEFTLVQDGVIVDYITTRRTTPSIAQWYDQKGMPVRSHGCATRTGGIMPVLTVPNLSMAPGRDSTTVDDLIRGVKKGFYIESVDLPVPDQQFINVHIGGGRVREIKNGTLGEQVRDMAIQFNTAKFWNSVSAIGGAQSTEVNQEQVDSPSSTRITSMMVAAVPLLVHDVTVVSTGRRI